MFQDSVSVVIPTVGRTDLISRAIQSALNQTYGVLEIIVVVDGQVDAIEELCQTIDAEKIKVYQLGTSHGGSYARNFGIKKAKGTWIALLDDDDEWFDYKLEKQFDLVKSYPDHKIDMVFSKLTTYTKSGQQIILPRKEWKASYRIDDYLFKPFFGRYGGYIQTSGILARKSLFEAYPFTNGLPKHQDWDWLVKIQSKKDLVIDCPKEPLLYYHQDISASVGKINRWRNSREWISSVADKISKSAYDYFHVLIVIPDMLNDAKLTKDEKVRFFREFSKELAFGPKLSIKYILLLIKFYKTVLK